jgi:hypothetical protein
VQGERDGCLLHVYSNTFLAFTWGGAKPLFGMRCISGSVCICAVLDSKFKLWMYSVHYCRTDERDVFYIDLRIEKLFSLNVLCRSNEAVVLWCGLIEEGNKHTL